MITKKEDVVNRLKDCKDGIDLSLDRLPQKNRAPFLMSMLNALMNRDCKNPIIFVEKRFFPAIYKSIESVLKIFPCLSNDEVKEMRNYLFGLLLKSNTMTMSFEKFMSDLGLSCE